MQSVTAHGSARRSRPVRIVVIDDDDGIRTLLEVTTGLDPRYELVASGGSGADARRLVADEPGAIDVVLLDVTLPDVDGIELLRELHAQYPDVRIALFTGWSDDGTMQRAQDAGAVAVFGKDGDPKGLLDGIAKLVPDD